MGSKPRAIIFPEHLPEQAFCFHDPVAVFKGGGSDWSILDEYLSDRTVVATGDNPVPPGALVGGFTYEGEFCFEAYNLIEVVERDGLLPEISTLTQAAQVEWKEHVNRSEYCQMVEAAREYIARGEIYQVNLTRAFETRLDRLDPYDFFRVLYWRTQAPLAAMIPLDLNGKEKWVCSSSPELFLQIVGDRIKTRPIKGTRPRDRDADRDRQNAFDLRTSDKEIAELVMITDLERNDLGKICEYGSVCVPELLRAEVFSHVHHLISTVEGVLKSGMRPVEAVRSCFPGGSITGAPKRRSMEVIRELESQPRGIYTGAIGYFGYDNSAQFNIAIRTAEISANHIKFFTGSGITWDSNPDQEFDETCHKAAGIKEAVDAYASMLNFQLPTSNIQSL